MLAALIISAVIVGLISGAMGWTLLAAALVWITVHWREYQKIATWASHPWRKPTNGLDAWFELAYGPYRALLRQRDRTRSMGTRLRQILRLLEVIPDGVIVLSASGEIESLNTAAKSLLHLSQADVGIGLATVVRSPDFVEFVRAENTDAPLEFTSPFDLDTTLEARCFNIDDGENGGRIMLVRDITALNRLLTVRQNFVANVSHELRTPLAVVNGYMETIADQEEDTDLRLQLIDKLEPPLQRMQSLIDDLMLLTQLESGSEPPKRNLNLGNVVNNAVAELGGIIGFATRLNLQVDTQQKILGIDHELHSVCVNLISNALRYSPEDMPIEVSCEDRGDVIRLAVRDHGVGIAPEHLNRLTERFYRVDMADARTRGGTGLGLAIVKHVLRHHDSTLQIDTELGVGSTFYCDFAAVPEIDNHKTPIN